MRRLVALVYAALAFTGCTEMPLDKKIVSWPLVGGLDSKTGPLAQQPGSFLTLDNVRQERLHEWRRRQAITHLNAYDDVGIGGGLPPLRTVEMPGGGLFGMRNPTAAMVTAPMTYAFGLPPTSKWVAPPTSQLDTGVWKRRALGSDGSQILQYSLAVGGDFRLVAWKTGTGVYAGLVSNFEGAVSSVPVFSVGTVNARNPKAVYDSVSNRFLLFFGDSADLKVVQWNGATGALMTTTTLKGDLNNGPTFIDAIRYGGAATTVTVVYRMTASGNAHQLEVNPATLALTADVDLAVNADGALALLPDPDASGVRLIGLCTAGAPGAVRVLRTNTAGAIATNDLIDATVAAIQVIGCAYQAGAGYMVVYKDLTGGALWAAKKYSGTVGAPTQLTPAFTGKFFIDSNAWREPGTDAMHYMAGLHVGNSGAGATSDFQQNYYEMALEYDTGFTPVVNMFTEPQARLLPLNAGPPVSQSGCAAQVVRVEANHFALPLGRIARPSISRGLRQNQYSVDQWDVIYLTTASALTGGNNLGPGIKGPQAAYLPAGSLLQTVTGQMVVAHGASAFPNRPVPTAVAGAGLTSGANYQYVVTDERQDEGGNVWRSGTSSPSVVVVPSGGNLAVDLVVTLSSFEHAERSRTIKIWRTLGNGSVYQLVNQRTISCALSQSSFTFNDTITDVDLALSDFLPVGLLASITPAFSHVAFFDGRMWGAQRDYPNRLSFSQPNQAGISPEFPGEFEVSGLADEFGDITGLGALDDKLIVFKQSAIYFIPMGGPGLDGSGRFYEATRVTSDSGQDIGAPIISVGDSVWFFCDGGVRRIGKNLQIDFVGAPIDKWFNQQLAETPEVPISFTHNHDRNEIRLLTTNYRFVYDTIHDVWIRDTVGPAGSLLMQHVSEHGDIFVRTNGQIWWDFDDESTSYSQDAAGDYEGTIRSPWMRLADVEGYMRLYSARSIWARVPTGASGQWPTTAIYFNNTDSVVETYGPFGTSSAADVQAIEFRPVRQKCSAFSLELRLPNNDVQWRVAQWTVLVAAKRSLHRARPASLGRGTASQLPRDGLVFWVRGDADLPNALGTVTGPWLDQSGYDQHLDVFSFPPSYVANAIDGVPGIGLTLGTYMERSALLHDRNSVAFSGGKARTIFVVCKPNAGNGTRIGGPLVTFRSSNGAGGYCMYHLQIASLGGHVPAQVVHDWWPEWSTPLFDTVATSFANTPILVEDRYVAAGNLTRAINGVDRTLFSTAVGVGDNGGANVFTIGNIGGFTAYGVGWLGSISEVMVYDYDLTTAPTVLARVRSYLAGRFPSIGIV